VNVDLCFVPATHQVAEAVPAVSGSSGKLVVRVPKEAETERRWPGRVFERPELSYTEAVDQFVAARREAQAPGAGADPRTDPTAADGRAARRALQRQTQQLRRARRQERERRRLVDQAWQAHQQEQQPARVVLEERQTPPRTGRRRPRSTERAARKAQKRAEWVQRHQELERRRQEDARWREQRHKLLQREQALGLRPLRVWIAVLVIVDNCTRRCLGLPLFVLGAHVTAELVVEALQALLPKELKYLIADGGTHFTAAAMQQLATGQGFVRVPLARHRPQSNGIAERFIETLKVGLADKKWQTAEELLRLLADFLADYNDRPHQGRELAGLSPNEYNARLLAA
jgi:flagellar biosynthesis GTPase FlhF